jgi:rubrerythrin
MEDEWELAQIFQDAAEGDRTQHFSKEAERDGLIAHSLDNLRNSIDAETKQMNMFAQFAREAIEDGDRNAAALFDRVSGDKAQSRRRFEAILQKMGLHSDTQNVEVSQTS